MKKNAFMVISSNMLTLLVSLFMGFVLPIFLTIDDYAYFRVYQLYIAYAGIFHLGIINGIYLKYGHLNVEQLPVNTFKRYGRAIVNMQISIAVLLMVILILKFPQDYNTGIAYIFTIINIPLVNIKWFYSSINQFTKRFDIDSTVTYIQNLLQFLAIIAVLIMHWYSYIPLLVAITIINLLCMIAVMYQNRKIISIFGRIKEQVSEDETTIHMIKSGFFFMISEFVAIVILLIDSVFVQNLFTLTDFAMYSFATSIISVMYGVINTVSNLIYPYLVRVNNEKYAKYYTLMSDMLTVIALFSMLAFYVAKLIVEQINPKYEASIEIASVLFGTVIFRTLILLVCGNYFKVLKMTSAYTKNNFFAIFLAFMLDLAAYIVFKDYKYIAYASLLTFIIWYMLTDVVFIKRLRLNLTRCVKRYICISACLVIFYLLLNMKDLTAFILYFIGTALICLACFSEDIKEIMNERKISLEKE